MPITTVVHAIVLAGGSGERLGGRAKSELPVGGTRLLDLIARAIEPFVTGRLVILAPEAVQVPARALRTLEDPPGGGPLAGIEAGMAALSPATDDWVLVAGVDTPALGALTPLLVQALGSKPRHDGALVVGGEPEPFRQYLQALYRTAALTRALRKAGPLRNRGVRRVLGGLDLLDVPVEAELCRDLDTPEDLQWWQTHLDVSRAEND
ncbi:MAG: molybdenum cofactor guanylyltransferase [Propionibacterium sp.]